MGQRHLANLKPCGLGISTICKLIWHLPVSLVKYGDFARFDSSTQLTCSLVVVVPGCVDDRKSRQKTLQIQPDVTLGGGLAGGCHGKSCVDADAPVERTLQETLRIFAGLHEPGSFLGIELDWRFVLQFAYEEGLIYTEILDTHTGTIEHCTLNVPLAEEVIRQAFNRGDIRAVPGQAFILWNREAL